MTRALVPLLVRTEVIGADGRPMVSLSPLEVAAGMYRREDGYRTRRVLGFQLLRDGRLDFVCVRTISARQEAS